RSMDRARAIEQVTKTVNATTKKLRTDRHVNDGTRTLDGVAFLDVAVITEDHDADIVDFEVQRHAADTARELDHFTCLDVVQTVNASNTVADGKHLAYLRDLGLRPEILNLIPEDCGNFRRADIHQPTSFSANLRQLSFALSYVSLWREPTRTTRPPSSDGSTVTLRVTSLPTTSLRAACRARSWS